MNLSVNTEIRRHLFKLDTMRKNPTHKIEQFRVRAGALASDKSYGANGAFMIPLDRITLSVIASDGSGWIASRLPLPAWEHVSVSIPHRCPTWEEMDSVKRIFWRDDETVLQLHVPRNQHVNLHEFCLHLWRPIGVDLPLPPLETLGPVGA